MTTLTSRLLFSGARRKLELCQCCDRNVAERASQSSMKGMPRHSCVRALFLIWASLGHQISAKRGKSSFLLALLSKFPLWPSNDSDAGGRAISGRNHRIVTLLEIA